MSLWSGLLDRVRRMRKRYGQVRRMGVRLRGWRAYLNLAHGYLEYLSGATVVRSRPVKLIFDPTNACHLACPLCPTGVGMIDRKTGHADIRLFESLMEQLGRYLFFVDFYNWGDPLLNPRLEEFIRIASVRGVISTVSSNLSVRLSDERIDRLIASGVNEIVVSLDGASAETHTKYRRNSDFDLICGNMQRLVAARRKLGRTTPLITWQFVVFRFNEREIDTAKAMAVALGVDRIAFRPPFIQPDRYQLTEEDRREIASWSPSDPRYVVHVRKQPERRRCGWHYTALAVNWDGTATPCSTVFKQADDFGSFGKAGETAFARVINNSAFRAARGWIARRTATAGGLICERCPTPSIQNYHHYVYRQIAIVTAVAIVQAVLRRFQARTRILAANPAT